MLKYKFVLPILAVLLLSMVPLGIASTSISLDEGDYTLNIGDKVTFETDVLINGIYDSKDEDPQPEYNVEVKKGDIWDTSSLQKGLYIVYNLKEGTYVWVTFNLPSDIGLTFMSNERATVGDTVILSGKSNLGPLSLLVDGAYTKSVKPDCIIPSNGEFEYALDTSTLPTSEGMYRITIFYDTDKDGYQPCDPHATNRLFVTSPILTSNLSNASSTDLKFKVSGDATGTDEVQVWICGNGISGLCTLPVINGRYQDDITIDDINYWFTPNGMVDMPLEMQRGIYTVLVVNPCTDGYYQYGSLEGTGSLLAARDGVTRLNTAMMTSDNVDIVDVGIINVELPFISFDTSSSGDKAIIRGNTNIGDGRYLIVTIDGVGYNVQAKDNSFILEVSNLQEGTHKVSINDELNTVYGEGTFNTSLSSVIEEESLSEEPITPVEETKKGFSVPWVVYVVIGIVIVIAILFKTSKNK